jgi:SRSO17 transposase
MKQVSKRKGRQPLRVKWQYIGNLGKIENGIVVVTVYDLLEGMTFPLSFLNHLPKLTAQNVLGNEASNFMLSPKVYEE